MILGSTSTDFTTPVFGWTYFHGTFYLIYKEALNVFRDGSDRGRVGDDGAPGFSEAGQA